MNTLKSPKTFLLGVLVLLLLPAQLSFAQTIKELTTDVSIIGRYDDNIFLEKNIRRGDDLVHSDYLITVRPSFNFQLRSEHTELGLGYAPSFVRYIQFNENTIRHRGNLSFRQDLSEHFRFYLNDTFLHSDDPLSEQNVIDSEEDVTGGDRRTREDYMVNIATAELSYLFGQAGTLAFGYNDRRLRNDDDTENDGTIVNPYASITYNIDIRNRLEIEYGYSKGRFWNDSTIPASDDYSGHEPAITYSYKFTPHTTGALGYSFTTRNFDGDRILSEEDYKVHSPSIAFEHSFSPDFSISAGAGYFVQKRDHSSDQSGPSYNLSFTKTFERGNIDIGGAGGWSDDNLLSRQDSRGFSKFYSAEARGNYQILNRLSGNARLYYRHDKSENRLPWENDDKWERIRGNCGLSWNFLPRFSLALDYDYSVRNDDIEFNEYTDRRVTLALRYRMPSEW